MVHVSAIFFSGGYVKILVINSGSSSLKYTLFDMNTEGILLSGDIDRIGLSGGTHTFRDAQATETVREANVSTIGEALDVMFSVLAEKGFSDLEVIQAVAHRVGHGGKYKQAALINSDVLNELHRMTPMVPLHHPAMIKEIEECCARMPHAQHVAVFDTSFHHTIPDKAAIYGLPYTYFADRGYRVTGFHGYSHEFVANKAAEFVKRPIEDLNIITCHLGNGSSIAAIQGGKSIDTSLGMTAVPGLIMGTRSGDVDAGLIPVIMKEDGLSSDDMLDLLYRKSGLLGISGVSRDMREVIAAALADNARAQLALDAYCYKVKRYIGAMLTVLGRCDIVTFAGGIGKNNPLVRRKAVEGCEPLGLIINDEKNNTSAEDEIFEVSEPDSKIKILAVETFEELLMARDCLRVVNKAAKVDA